MKQLVRAIARVSPPAIQLLLIYLVWLADKSLARASGFPCCGTASPWCWLSFIHCILLVVCLVDESLTGRPLEPEE